MKFTYGFVYMTGFMESRWTTFKLCQEILIQKPKAMVRITYWKISRDIFIKFHPCKNTTVVEACKTSDTSKEYSETQFLYKESKPRIHEGC